MDFSKVKYEIQNILQGKSSVSHGKLIQTNAAYLRKSTATTTLAKGNEPNKQKETME